MKKITGLLTASILSMLTSSAFAGFDVDETLTIVNHFPVPLTFKVSAVNPRNIARIPMTFTLNSGKAISGEIRHLGSDGRPVQEVFFRVEEIAQGDSDHGFYNAFWGTHLKGRLQFNRYDHYPYEYGIAYSWAHDSVGSSVITFCSEDEYKKHGHC